MSETKVVAKFSGILVSNLGSRLRAQGSEATDIPASSLIGDEMSAILDSSGE